MVLGAMMHPMPILAVRYAALSQPHLMLWACLLLAAVVAMQVGEAAGQHLRRWSAVVVSILLGACALVDTIGPGLCEAAERMADIMR